MKWVKIYSHNLKPKNGATGFFVPFTVALVKCRMVQRRWNLSLIIFGLTNSSSSSLSWRFDCVYCLRRIWKECKLPHGRMFNSLWNVKWRMFFSIAKVMDNGSLATSRRHATLRAKPLIQRGIQFKFNLKLFIIDLWFEIANYCLRLCQFFSFINIIITKLTNYKNEEGGILETSKILNKAFYRWTKKNLLLARVAFLRRQTRWNRRILFLELRPNILKTIIQLFRRLAKSWLINIGCVSFSVICLFL